MRPDYRDVVVRARDSQFLRGVCCTEEMRNYPEGNR